MNQEVNIGTHFAKQQNQYQQVVNTVHKEWYQNIQQKLDQNLHGVVLDIGNGGVFGYNLTKLKRIIAIDPAFDETWQNTDKIQHIAGDARHLSTIKDNGCDCVIMQLILHHVVEKNIKLTNESILQSLKEAHRVLKPSGKLIIIEQIVSPTLESIEDIFYPTNFYLLGLFNIPMVKFYSLHHLHSKLHSTDFTQITTKKIHMGQWYDPLGGVLPGIIKIPTWLSPTRCHAIIAIK
ncbi:class I SAM-dependent methyltransferase [Patescibacteria group bacterium]|nr:class I SAM-dependent methyltransferase [Patescibacteria group bacterium]